MTAAVYAPRAADDRLEPLLVTGRHAELFRQLADPAQRRVERLGRGARPVHRQRQPSARPARARSRTCRVALPSALVVPFTGRRQARGAPSRSTPKRPMPSRSITRASRRDAAAHLSRAFRFAATTSDRIGSKSGRLMPMHMLASRLHTPVAVCDRRRRRACGVRARARRRHHAGRSCATPSPVSLRPLLAKPRHLGPAGGPRQRGKRSSARRTGRTASISTLDAARRRRQDRRDARHRRADRRPAPGRPGAPSATTTTAGDGRAEPHRDRQPAAGRACATA